MGRFPLGMLRACLFGSLVCLVSTPAWSNGKSSSGSPGASRASAWNEGLNASWLRMEMPLRADVRYGAEPDSDEDAPHLLQDMREQPVPRRDIARERVRPIRLVLDDAGKRTDLSVFDMQHNFEVFSVGYSALFTELRVLIVNREDLLPVFSLYRPASDICYLGLNRSDSQWRRLTEKLNLFDVSDDLAVIQEIAAAHEVGHCVAARYLAATNQKWSINQRELFADVFALQHVQAQYVEDDAGRFNAFEQLARFRAGGPKDATGPTPKRLAAIFDVMEAEGLTLLGATQAVELLVERVVELMGVEGLNPK